MGALIRYDDPVVWPVLPILLQDKTMRRNIIWTTSSYASLGEYYSDTCQMNVAALRNMGGDSIQPRTLKAQDEQLKRTRSHGEVYTPAWVCNQMNNHLDDAWFGREDVFNVPLGQTWTPTEGPVAFPKRRHARWQMYVDSRRLEITCGEAPFIASRYDAATGESLPIERRIGLLDRKLRIVNENAGTEQEWMKWAIRAVQSVYGYEYQGDNLLIARINVLLTFAEYLQARWRRGPTQKELRTAARIVAWNFWQMDGLTGTAPKGKLQAPEPEVRPITMDELGWFASIDAANPPVRPQERKTMPPCRVCNWRQAHTVPFNSLKTHRGRDVRNMKFDYVIGNPPYQDVTDSDSNRMPPVYNLFMDAANEVSNVVELITPARFLFNAGYTPKEWNEHMLNDPHFKVLFYEPNNEGIFPNTEIKGGIVISYRDSKKDFGSIGTFTKYPELNKILKKVKASCSVYMDSIIYPTLSFKLSQLMLTEHPDSIGRLRTSAFKTLDIIFHENKPNDGHEYIIMVGVLNNKRTRRYVRRDYIVDGSGTLDMYTLLVPNASGNGKFGEKLSSAEIAEPGVAFSQSFNGFGCFDNNECALNVERYIKTKFARAMLGVLKITQHLPAPKWRFVPLQDFSPASDIDWTQPIPAIDRQLYRKYGLTDEEIAFIETHVKEMT